MVTNSKSDSNSGTAIYWSTIVIIIIGILVLLGFIIFGKTFRPSQGQTFIDPKQTITSPICQQERVPCNGPDDLTTCQKCIDNVEIKCRSLERTPDQAKIYGDGGYYCLPEKPSKPCDMGKGGIWVWTGWASTDRMEWDCLCTYPGYAGNEGCTKWNPDICKGGNFVYDATQTKYQNVGPSVTDCTCPSGYNLLSADPGGIPICVPAGDYLCKDKKMCETMYSNSLFVSN